MINNTIKMTAAALALSITSVANAGPTYSHTQTNANGVTSNYLFNTSTKDFSLSFEVNSGAGVDGFWFVVNDGPQPLQQNQGNYAIFYSDLSSVWSYQYTGWNNGANNSYQNTLLEKFDGVVNGSTENGVTTYSMSFNVSTLNGLNLSNDWDGLYYDDYIGTWLHPTRNTFDTCNGSYETNGSLSCFASNNWLGWDESYRKTTEVPEPSAIALLGVGLIGLGLSRRRVSK